MQMKSMKVITAAISTSFFLVTIAMAAEKAAVKDAIKEAVKDPKAAAQKVIPKQVRTEGGSANATAAAAKAFEVLARRGRYPVRDLEAPEGGCLRSEESGVRPEAREKNQSARRHVRST